MMTSPVSQMTIDKVIRVIQLSLIAQDIGDKVPSEADLSSTSKYAVAAERIASTLVTEDLITTDVMAGYTDLKTQITGPYPVLRKQLVWGD